MMNDVFRYKTAAALSPCLIHPCGWLKTNTLNQHLSIRKAAATKFHTTQMPSCALRAGGRDDFLRCGSVAHHVRVELGFRVVAVLQVLQVVGAYHVSPAAGGGVAKRTRDADVPHPFHAGGGVSPEHAHLRGGRHTID